MPFGSRNRCKISLSNLFSYWQNETSFGIKVFNLWRREVFTKLFLPAVGRAENLRFPNESESSDCWNHYINTRKQGFCVNCVNSSFWSLLVYRELCMLLLFIIYYDIYQFNYLNTERPRDNRLQVVARECIWLSFGFTRWFTERFYQRCNCLCHSNLPTTNSFNFWVVQEIYTIKRFKQEIRSINRHAIY